MTYMKYKRISKSEQPRQIPGKPNAQSRPEHSFVSEPSHLKAACVHLLQRHEPELCYRVLQDGIWLSGCLLDIAQMFDSND